MYASQVKKQVRVGEHTFDVRKLSWKSLKKARDARSIDQAAHLRALGGEIMRALHNPTVNSDLAKAEANVAAQRADPKAREKARYDSYDRETVLVAGVERIDGEPVVLERLNDIDEDVSEQVFYAIVDLSDPPAEVTEAAGKDSSGASTSS